MPISNSNLENFNNPPLGSLGWLSSLVSLETGCCKSYLFSSRIAVKYLNIEHKLRYNKWFGEILVTNAKQEQECGYLSLHLRFLSLTKLYNGLSQIIAIGLCSSLGSTHHSSFLSKLGINEFHCQFLKNSLKAKA